MSQPNEEAGHSSKLDFSQPYVLTQHDESLDAVHHGGSTAPPFFYHTASPGVVFAPGSTLLWDRSSQDSSAESLHFYSDGPSPAETMPSPCPGITFPSSRLASATISRPSTSPCAAQNSLSSSLNVKWDSAGLAYTSGSPPRAHFPDTLSPEEHQRLSNVALSSQPDAMLPGISLPNSLSGTPVGHMPSACCSDKNGPQTTSAGMKRGIQDLENEDEVEEHGKLAKRRGHNEIERRYRVNLNRKICELRDAVPAVRIPYKTSNGEDTTEDREQLHGLAPAGNFSKVTACYCTGEEFLDVANLPARLSPRRLSTFSIWSSVTDSSSRRTADCLLWSRSSRYFAT